MSDAGALVPQVAAAFGLHWGALREDLAVAGSPQRSAWRGVMADADGVLYLAEELTPGNVELKRRIAERLAFLTEQRVPGVHPQCATPQGEYIAQVDGHAWQVRAYIDGEPLPRPDWVWDAWRGVAWAEFLLALRRAGAHMPARLVGEVFWLRTFIEEFVRRLRLRRLALLAEVQPALDALHGDYFLREPRLPMAFCHGDCHALNVIWGPRAIRSVIDWEFCGLKPALYDAALLIGCVGAEEPEALNGPLVRALLAGLASEPELMAQAEALPDMVLAARFCWLSEWLRQDDLDMIILEVDTLARFRQQIASLAEW